LRSVLVASANFFTDAASNVYVFDELYIGIIADADIFDDTLSWAADVQFVVVADHLLLFIGVHGCTLIIAVGTFFTTLAFVVFANAKIGAIKIIRTSTFFNVFIGD
jgi:hypothetical protein